MRAVLPLLVSFLLAPHPVGGANKDLNADPISVDVVANFAPATTFPHAQVADPQGYLETGEAAKIEAAVLEAAEGTTDFQAYALIVGRMQRAAAWPVGEEADLIVLYANELKKTRIPGKGGAGCVGNCVLFVLSVGDRALKLNSLALADERKDAIVEGAKYHLRERAYGDAVRAILLLSAQELNPRAQEHAALFFFCTFVTFSAAAGVLLRPVPYVWAGLLVTHLLLQHWAVLLIVAVVTVSFYVKGGAPTQQQQNDPWANV